MSKPQPIWKNGDFFQIIGKDGTNQRIDMDPTVVELPPDEMGLPLAWNYDWDGEKGPYGTVNNIRLEDGEIVGEMTIFDPSWDEGTMDVLKLRLGGYYTEVEKSEDGTQVLKCKLQGVSLMTLQNTPGWQRDDGHDAREEASCSE